MPLPYRRRPVATADGHALGLFRREADTQRAVGDRRPPVLLLPGLGANRFTFGLRPDAGLPARLADAGWDVWLGELRGARSSSPPTSGPARMAPQAKLAEDVPALLAAVREATGATRVAVVGHSLGGLLALLTAGRAPDGGSRDLAAIVTICTPLFAAPPSTLGALGAGLVSGLARHLGGGLAGGVPVAPLARAGRRVARFVAPASHFLPGGTSPDVLQDYFTHAVEDIPLAEAAALLGWRLRGELAVDAGAPRGLTGWLGRVRVPVLSVAGNRDGVAPPACTRRAFEAIGSPERRWLPVGRENGTQADYAHADVLLGTHAEADVIRPIVDFLAPFRAA